MSPLTPAQRADLEEFANDEMPACWNMAYLQTLVKALLAATEPRQCQGCANWERSHTVRGSDIDLPNPPRHATTHGRCGAANCYMNWLFTDGEDSVFTGEAFACSAWQPLAALPAPPETGK